MHKRREDNSINTKRRIRTKTSTFIQKKSIQYNKKRFLVSFTKTLLFKWLIKQKQNLKGNTQLKVDTN